MTKQDAEQASNDQFWKKERVEIIQRNMNLATKYEGHVPELKRRQGRRTTFVFTCMDERMAMVEDRLGLLPGEAIVFTSCGGKIEIDDLAKVYGTKIEHSIKAHRQTVICLVAHECAGEPKLGCTEFEDSTSSQNSYFTDLQNKLEKAYPTAFVHYLMLDTATGRMIPIRMDERDDHMAGVVSNKNNLVDRPPKDIQHAGYGLYIGDAYQAWIPDDNTYFRLSCLNPNLGNDAKKALDMMIQQAIPEKTGRPIVIHIDYPIYPDISLTGSCRHNIENQIETLLKKDDTQKIRHNGQLKVMRTETEMSSWRGMDIS